MHVYRVAGMLKAMIDAAGNGASYQGASDVGAIIGMLMGEGQVNPGVIGGEIEVTGYLGGYDMDEAWFAKGAEMVQSKGLEVLLAVGSGSDFFGTSASGTNVKIASVDAFAASYSDAMKAGILDYMAGKFSAYDAAVFVAVYRAALGAPIRNNDGSALALDMGYWIATNADEFDKCLAVDKDTANPVFTKEDLDPLFSADYNTFASFVGNYDFASVSK